MPEEPEPTPSTALTHFTPVPRLKDRSNGWSPDVQRAFIEALADTGSVKSAARAVGRSEVGAYQLRRHPQGAEFAAAWAAALAHGVQRIEDVAMERAINGTEEPVYSYGKLVGTRMKYNDGLLMFMLRNRAPERFAGAGPARGLSAMDRTKTDRLKKQWRKEWEAEREAESVSPAEIRASIERKVAALKRRVQARTSPRAYELHLASTAQSRADEEAGWLPGTPYEPYAKRAAELLPAFIEQVRSEWPSYEEAHPPPTEEELAEWADAAEEERKAEAEKQKDAPDESANTGPRIRQIKDERW